MHVLTTANCSLFKLVSIPLGYNHFSNGLTWMFDYDSLFV